MFSLRRKGEQSFIKKSRALPNSLYGSFMKGIRISGNKARQRAACFFSSCCIVRGKLCVFLFRRFCRACVTGAERIRNVRKYLYADGESDIIFAFGRAFQDFRSPASMRVTQFFMESARS